MKSFACASLLVLLGVAASGAQAPSLDETLASVRRPIALRDGRLDGPGGELLRAALRATPYVLVGEDHGLAEIPAFSAAVFRELAARGVRDLVLEVGPEAGRRLTRAVNAADPDAEIQRWVRQYPFSLAFYDLVQEFQFLRQARAAAGPGLRITGVDQELMGASRMLLESVAARDDALPGLLALEQQAYARAVASGNPLDLFMLTGPADALGALRDRLARATPARDAGLVTSLLESRRIYELNAQSGYQSNLTRAALMKRYYVEQTPPDLRAAPPPTLFKFGAYHVMKGLNLLESREIGNYVAEVADGRGTPSLHILVMAVKGRQRRFDGVGKPYTAAPVDQVGPGVSDFPFAKPVFERALAEEGWSLFDFREMRRWALRQAGLDPRLLRMVSGFDLAVLIPEGTPSDQIQ
ncbi:MAG: hypothetical protein R2708_08355 [Vicinamibacterales bacterium]